MIIFGDYKPIDRDVFCREIDTKYVVHFRPSSDWQGIGYGFDWMRTGDYKEILAKAGASPTYGEGDTPYKDLVTRQFRSLPDGFDPSVPGQKVNADVVGSSEIYDYTFYQDDIAKMAYQKMEHEEYDCFKIADTGEKYYCPWLSLYPPCPPEAVNCEWNNEAKLSLIIEVLTERTANTPPLVLNFTPANRNIEIEILKQAEISQLPKGRHIIPDALIIRCVKEFDTKQRIEVRLKEQSTTTAGRLYIYPNGKAHRKIANILPVLLKTLDDRPVSQIEGMQTGATQYLRQAMIEPIDIRTVIGGFNNYFELDVYEEVNEKGEKVFQSMPGATKETDGSFRYAVATQDDNEEGGLIAKCSAKFKDNKGEWQSVKEADSVPPMVDVLNQAVERELKKYGIDANDYIKLYYLDQPLFTKDIVFDNATRQVESVTYSPLAGAYVNGKSALYLNPNRLTSTVVAHEVLHAMGIPHTFATKSTQKGTARKDPKTGKFIQQEYTYNPDAKYTFSPQDTDNIMDYSDMGNYRTLRLKKGDQYLDEEKNEWAIMPHDGYGTGMKKIPVYTTWKWQWEVVARNISENGKITEHSHE